MAMYVSEGEMSKLGDILTALATKIGTVAPSVPITVAKRVAIREGDSVPRIVIAPLTDEIVDEGFGGSNTWQYRVVVAYVTSGNLIYDDDLYAFLDVREAIRNELEDTTPGYDTKLEPASPQDLAALDAGYDASAMIVRIRNAE